MDYRFAVLHFSYRPGSLDLLKTSLEKQSYRNFKIILVDDWKDRDIPLVKQYFGDMLHWIGPSKKPCYPDLPFNQMNCLNTALYHLPKGTDILLTVSDFTSFRPDGMKRWNDSFNKHGLDCVITGAGCIYQQKDFVPHVHSIDTGAFQGEWTMKEDWIPDEKVIPGFEMFHFSCPIQVLNRVNWFPEKADTWREYPIYMFSAQMRANGIKMVVDKENIVDILDHREWEPKDLWSINYLHTKTRRNDFMRQDAPIVYATKVSENCFDCNEVLKAQGWFDTKKN